MKARGEAACTPIGWSTCGEGFERDPSGWGCREVLAGPCTGATRGALGATSCVPVGDCDAPFPPANARLFVSASGPTDATHFRSLYAAALASRTGDVIAVDSGTYRESVQLDRAVSVVGRCAEKVIFDGSGVSTPGLIVLGRSSVSGLTLRKFNVAIQLEAGLVLEDSVIEDSDDIGIYAEGSAIDARITRSVVRNTTAVGSQPAFGIDLALGTTMSIADSEIAGNEGAGIIVTPGSKVSIERSVIRDSKLDARGTGGYGINGQGGDATITGSAFIGNAEAGVRAYKNATFDVERTVVRGTRPGERGRGYGIVATTGATLRASKIVVAETIGLGVVVESSKATLTDAVVRGQKPAPDGDFGDGVYAFNGGSISLSRVAILDNARSGVSLFDAKTEGTFDHVLLTDTRALPAGDMGLGIAIGFGAHGAIDTTVVANNHHTGIYVFDGSTLDLTKSAVRDTSVQGSSVPLGHGVLVTDSKRVVITDTEVRRSAGIGVALANTSAIIASCVIADNAVGIHVQDGSTLNQVATAPKEPAGLAVDVTEDTQFEGNATRVGSGVVPLPDPLTRL
jgi:nitrous oxidase accessory protein NosD